MLAPDKRLKVSPKLAHSPAPCLDLLPHVGCKLRMKKYGPNCLITAEFEFENKKAARRNRDGNTIDY